MRRIKTILIKRTAIKMLNENSELFTNEFGHNKAAVDSLADVPSKKMRNIISGYISRLMRQKEKTAAENKHAISPAEISA